MRSANGIRLDASEVATPGLLSDLRSDRGMGWIPARGWLTKVAVDGTASQLGYDLAVDASGAGRPSAVAAGLAMSDATPGANPIDLNRLLLAVAFVGIGLASIGVIGSARGGGRPLAS